MEARHASVRTAIRTDTGLLSAIQQGRRHRGNKSSDEEYDDRADNTMVGDVDGDINGDTDDGSKEKNPFEEGSGDDDGEEGDGTKSVEASSEEDDASNKSQRQ